MENLEHRVTSPKFEEERTKTGIKGEQKFLNKTIEELNNKLTDNTNPKPKN